jgi:hypothetical protein
MRASFIYAFLLGLAGVLATGYFAPWAQHERVASKTSVAMNGGRRETFLIYLPSDRLVEVADRERYPTTAATTLTVPELTALPLLAEHFKLRDMDGTVIGLATRHWSATPTGSTSVWAVDIPGRGALVLAGDGDVAGQLASALAGAGVIAGLPWSGEVEVGVADVESASRVVVGTEEFSGVGGRYSETWRISGFSERGELQGTIVLDTIVNQT